jgi:hypothetical protein
MVADAALRGTARGVVVDAVAREDANRAVVHLHGEVHDEFPTGMLENLQQAPIEIQVMRRRFQLAYRNRIRATLFGVSFAFNCRLRHCSCASSVRYRPSVLIVP